MRLCLVLVLLLTMASLRMDAQDQRIADSLLVVVTSRDIPDTVLISHFEKISFNHGSSEIALEYAERAVSLADEIADPELVYSTNAVMGMAYQRSGEMELALESFFRSADFAEKLGFEEHLADAYLKIGDVYTNMGSFENARLYYKSAIKQFQEDGDLFYLATTRMNLGYSYYLDGSYDSALLHMDRAQSLFDSISHDMGKLYSTGNKGLVYAKMGKHDVAEDSMTAAIAKLREYENYDAIADFEKELADIYRQREDFDQAIAYGRSSYDIATQQGLKIQQRDASYMLYEIYRDLGRFDRAISYLNTYFSLRDSITNSENIQRIADLRTAFEVGQKQAEADLFEAQAKNRELVAISLGGVLLSVMVLAIVLYRNNNQKRRVNSLLQEQKTQLENLNHTKDRFFSIISHDLRGPVNAFHGVSRMIKFFVKNKQMDQLDSLAEEIDHSVDRLSELLDNLLNWAVQQQGHVPYIPEKLDIHEMADDLVHIFSTMANSKNVKLVSHVPKSIYLWGDRNTVNTIIRNLINNAIKFTPDEGTVTVDVEAQEETAVVRVSDTGVGIPEDKLQDLFRLQAKKSTWGTHGEKGLGLGLQLVHEFIELNRGKITVESEEGVGTTFKVWLPLYPSQIKAEATPG